MQKIAIISMSCLLPGSKTPDEFYASLLANQCMQDISDLPRIEAKHFKDLELPEIYQKLDVIFLHTLYVIYEALKSSGYYESSHILARTGIIMGARETCSPKLFELFAPAYIEEIERSIKILIDDENFSFNAANNNDKNSALNAFCFSYPTRLAARLLNIQGPAFSIDAACSSSLYSIKLAINYLLSGQADLMLAGGLLSGFSAAEHQHYFSVLGVSADNNQSRAFCAQSQGIVTNDGGGVIGLRRLEDAIADDDNILAVIDAVSWWSECGKERLMLAPNRNGQYAAYQQAFSDLEDDSYEPQDVDYIECHATGTTVGDKIELDTLENFYAQSGAHLQSLKNIRAQQTTKGKNKHKVKAKQPPTKLPLFGSVKGNIGHLLSGSGVVSLIKVICSFEKGMIPATYDVKEALASTSGKFAAQNLVMTNTPWLRSSETIIRRSAVSCFGFGGSHSHLLVSEYNEKHHRKIAELIKQRTKANASSNQSKPSSLKITGVGVQAGNLSGLGAVSAALKKQRAPIAGYSSGRLRGLEKSLQQNDAEDKNYYFPDFEFDFLKNGIKPSSTGEGLNKELMLLNVINEALSDAGFVRGEDRRVGVIVSARQVLFQVQLYLEYNLERLIKAALENTTHNFSEKQVEDLIIIARDSIVAANNMGFGFVATTIGPIIASRVTASWGFTGPTIKLGGSEHSFIRSVDLAKQLLEQEDLEAVVVASLEGDPALERKILYQQYGAEIAYDKVQGVLGDAAVAIVLTRDQPKQGCYAEIDGAYFNTAMKKNDLRASSSANNFSEVLIQHAAQKTVRFIKHYQDKSADKVDYLEYYAVYNNAIYKAFRKELKKGLLTENSELPNMGSCLTNFGYSYTASSALSVIKSIVMLSENFILVDNDDLDINSTAAGTAIGSAKPDNVTVVGLSFDTDLSILTLRKGPAVKSRVKKTTDKIATKKPSLIRKVSNQYSGIAENILSKKSKSLLKNS